MTAVRELNPAGIARARQLLAQVRSEAPSEISVPQELLFDDAFSHKLSVEIDVERQAFASRQEAADYLIPKLQPFRGQMLEAYGAWSWLGMFFLADNVRRNREGRVSLFKRDESYVLHDDGSAHVKRRRYVHYLWSAWQLALTHPDAYYLLYRPVMDQGDIADRIFSYPRIFNSAGAVELVLHLYTTGLKNKSGFASRTRGDLRHLIRLLDQLERTYDVYGMTPESLMDILPADFDRWKAEAV